MNEEFNNSFESKVIEVQKKAYNRGYLRAKEEELKFLDYVLREINIDLTIENLIHNRIKELSK